MTAPATPLMVTAVGPVTGQLSVLGCPRVPPSRDCRETGDGSTGFPPSPQPKAVVEPMLLLPVSVWDVVAQGLKTTEVPVTAPTPR